MAEYVFQEYPMWIYHFAEKAKIINTVDELTSYLAKGWKKEPFQFAKMEELKKKIQYFEGVILDLQCELDELMEKENVPASLVESDLESKDDQVAPSISQLVGAPAKEEVKIEEATPKLEVVQEELPKATVQRVRVGRVRQE
jgi:hypothetical protein